MVPCLWPSISSLGSQEMWTAEWKEEAGSQQKCSWSFRKPFLQDESALQGYLVCYF